MGSFIVRYFIARIVFNWARTVWRNPPDRFARVLGPAILWTCGAFVALFVLGLVFSVILG